MTKKHWAWILLALGVAMIYSLSQFTAGKVDTSTTMGKLENDLAQVGILVNPSTATSATPIVGYALVGIGAWMLWF